MRWGCQPHLTGPAPHILRYCSDFTPALSAALPAPTSASAQKQREISTITGYSRSFLIDSGSDSYLLVLIRPPTRYAREDMGCDMEHSLKRPPEVKLHLHKIALDSELVARQPAQCFQLNQTALDTIYPR